MDLTPFHGAPATVPRVPGFEARTLLGFGTHGEVWLADDLSSGGRVALKIGRRAGPESALAPAAGAVEHETALLCRIDHPHVVRLHRVVPMPGGSLALVLDLAAGGNLASLVAARGRFDPGEVSTLVVPLADALGHLHGRGVAHGDIAPGNVLFAADGRPQLGDLGVARVLGARSHQPWSTPGFTDPALTADGARADQRAADLWGLAAVGWFALTGRPPGVDPVPPAGAPAALTDLLARCLTAEPSRRPSLAELSEQAWRAAHPVPVRLVSARPEPMGDAGLPPLSQRVTRRVPVGGATVDPAPPEDPGRWIGRSTGPSAGRRSRGDRAGRWPGRSTGGRGPARWRLVPALGAAAATVALATGVAALLPEGGPARPDRSTGPGRPDPAAATAAASRPAAAPGDAGRVPAALTAEVTRALGGIARSRSRAFELASARHLAGADVSGSPAYQDDLRLVQRLRAQGYRLRGIRYRLADVRIVHRAGAVVDVGATVTTSGHRQVHASSGRSQWVPARPAQALVFSLAPLDQNRAGPDRWRVRAVRPAP